MSAGIPEEKRKELRARHPDGSFLVGPEGHEIFVGRPNRPAWKRFMKLADEPGRRLDAVEQLTKDCLIYPDKPGFDAMLDDRPALVNVFAPKVLEIAGLTGEAEIKKS